LLNRKDLEELAPAVRDALRFEFVETVDAVLEHGLEAEESAMHVSNNRTRTEGVAPRQ
jgi:ATP-dependent Lon protease